MNEGLYIGVRFALYANLMLLFGVPAFLRVGGPGLSFGGRRFGLILAGTGIVLSAFALALMTASMADVPVWALDSGTVAMIVTESPIGRAWIVRTLVLAVAAGLAVGNRKAGPPWLATCAAIALASLAWTGHGAAGEGVVGWAQLLADIGHLLAAGLWIGALAVLLAGAIRLRDATDEKDVSLLRAALSRFSGIGTGVVGILAVTGLVNGLVLVGPAGISALPGTRYGQVLIGKLGLFGLMLGLAALNRFRLTPALAQPESAAVVTAVRHLRFSLAAEAGSAAAILALVAWLGTLEPGV